MTKFKVGDQVMLCHSEFSDDYSDEIKECIARGIVAVVREVKHSLDVYTSRELPAYFLEMPDDAPQYNYADADFRYYDLTPAKLTSKEDIEALYG